MRKFSVPTASTHRGKPRAGGDLQAAAVAARYHLSHQSEGDPDELVDRQAGLVEPPREETLALLARHHGCWTSARRTLRLSPGRAVRVLAPDAQVEVFAAPAADDLDARPDSLSDDGRDVTPCEVARRQGRFPAWFR
jgi:hypothetical protein